MSCFSAGPKLRKATLALVGLDGAGKTHVYNWLRKEGDQNVQPTIGFVMEDIKVKKTIITMFDLGGGGRIRDIWERYYAELHGLIFVIDSAETDRDEELRQAWVSVRDHEFSKGKPILVLCNKQNAKGARSPQEIAEILEIEDSELIKLVACSMHGSDKTYSTVEKGFSWMFMKILDQGDALKERIKIEMAKQKEIERKERELKRERIRKRKEAALQQPEKDTAIAESNQEEQPTVTIETQVNDNTSINTEKARKRRKKKGKRTKRNQIAPMPPSESVL